MKRGPRFVPGDPLFPVPIVYPPPKLSHLSCSYSIPPSKWLGYERDRELREESEGEESN
jgi:hypothetical protein